MNIFVEITGWTGAVLVLGAYILVSTGRLTGTSPVFQAMNAFGAAFFVLHTWWHGALPSMAVNIIWSLIGFWALWKLKKASSASAK